MTNDAETARRLDRFLAEVERRAFRIAELATRDRDEALDIVQDAMLKLAQRYAHRTEEEWPALFYRILNNRINDWHRRGKVRRNWLSWWSDWRSNDTEDDNLEPEFAAPAHTDPLEQVAQQGAMEELIVVLGELPLRQQQAFLLRVWEGLDGAQTAFAMGCSEGSVKTHLSRATVRLRERLERHR
jgi:RNA polymerase sigma-70 factor (ECF subfamily)